MCDTSLSVQRKVHFDENTSVQFLGEFTCIRNDDNQLPRPASNTHTKSDHQLVDQESSFISCLILSNDDQSTSYCEQSKSNPDLVECSAMDTMVPISPKFKRQDVLLADTGQRTAACVVSSCGELCRDSAVRHESSTISSAATAITTASELCYCEHCDFCSDTLGNKFITKNSVTYSTVNCLGASSGDFLTSSSHSPSSIGRTNGSSSQGSSGTGTLYSFVPFLLVTGILSITLALLVSVSIIYIQCEYNGTNRSVCVCVCVVRGREKKR